MKTIREERIASTIQTLMEEYNRDQLRKMARQFGVRRGRNKADSAANVAEVLVAAEMSAQANAAPEGEPPADWRTLDPGDPLAPACGCVVGALVGVAIWAFVLALLWILKS